MAKVTRRKKQKKEPEPVKPKPRRKTNRPKKKSGRGRKKATNFECFRKIMGDCEKVEDEKKSGTSLKTKKIGLTQPTLLSKGETFSNRTYSK
jgi:hypothetical protein